MSDRNPRPTPPPKEQPPASHAEAAQRHIATATAHLEEASSTARVIEAVAGILSGLFGKGK